jgi:hypothetical protein
MTTAICWALPPCWRGDSGDSELQRPARGLCPGQRLASLSTHSTKCEVADARDVVERLPQQPLADVAHRVADVVVVVARHQAGLGCSFIPGKAVASIQAITVVWLKNQAQFNFDPGHLIPGPNTWTSYFAAQKSRAVAERAATPQ